MIRNKFKNLLQKPQEKPMKSWQLIESRGWLLFEQLKELDSSLREYNGLDLREVIKRSLEYLSEQMDTRFNFFISPKIGSYLDWIAKKKKTPRAVYLRKLIEKEMKENKEFNKT